MTSYPEATMKRNQLIPLGVFCFVWLSAAAVRAAEPFEVTIERGVAVKMRDGALLRADIYRPKAEGKYPVLLQRTPYNKAGGTGFGLKAAARGYVVIIQDVRGRFTSEGDWYPFMRDSQGCFDTVQEASALTYLTCRMCMTGMP